MLCETSFLSIYLGVWGLCVMCLEGVNNCVANLYLSEQTHTRIHIGLRFYDFSKRAILVNWTRQDRTWQNIKKLQWYRWRFCCNSFQLNLRLNESCYGSTGHCSACSNTEVHVMWKDCWPHSLNDLQRSILAWLYCHECIAHAFCEL